jgi:hypothetical protein
LAQQAEIQDAPTAKSPAITPKPVPEKGGMTKVEIKGSAQDYDPRRDLFTTPDDQVIQSRETGSLNENRSVDWRLSGPELETR